VELVYGANSSAGEQILQLAILYNVDSVSPRSKAPVGTITEALCRSSAEPATPRFQRLRRGN